MMSRVKQGIVAGFIATVVVSVLELVNLLFAKVFDPFPEVVSRMFRLGDNLAAGWAIHFVIGSLVMGPLFAILYERLPTRTPETRGTLFAVAAWVAMMLITHMVFGGVMGNVFARLLAREKRAAGFIHGAPAH